MENYIDERQLQELASKISLIDVRAELFKKRDFSFIVQGENEYGEIVTHEKQREALEILTANKYSEFLFGGAAGGSKILDNQGVILTPHGWKKGIDLKVGDLVNHPDGTVQRIIAIKPEIYVDKWTVYFSDGTSTDVGKEHLWQAWKGRKGRKINNQRLFGEQTAEVIETSELKEWLDRGYAPQIPVCKPQKFNRTTKEKNRIDPYLLGVLLGNGHISAKHINITFSEEDMPHLKEQIGEHEITYKGKTASFIGEKKKWLIKKLTLHNLIGKKSIDKFIPEVYKWASVEDRFAIVQGLMDTDGTSAKDKNACYYTSISKQLAEDVAFIIRSLGGIVTISEKKAGYKGKNGNYIQCNNAFELYIRIKNPNSLFRLKRKQHGLFGKNLVQKRVVDVKITGKIRGRCITVSNPNGLYITNDFIVTHNSWTGCVWIMFMAICYPNTKYFIARNELKDILDSVKVTFDKVARTYGFTDYKFNAVKNFILLGNGSHINFIELKYKPSDPMFEDVGSTEYTAGWIEEVGEINETGAAVISSRVGRHLNNRDEKGKIRKEPLKGIVLYTANPKQNWAKRDFYDKWKNGTLESDKYYLPCFITDNPFIESDYVEKLRKIGEKDKSLYERLFKGNWEYEDNPNQLAEQECIENIFDNKHVPEGKTYITADIARYGSDKAVIMAWSGWIVKEVITYDLSSIPEIVNSINYFKNKYRVPSTRTIVDADGIGGAVLDYVHTKAFKNNGTPIRTKGQSVNYRNLQVQCLYKLAEKINEDGLWIEADLTNKQKQEIKQELAQIQSTPNRRDDMKLDCKTKGDIKSDIGRSPDYRDCLLQRVFFDLKRDIADLSVTYS